jgi:histone acetyltransferase (RNA polymerase elongator complex component)
LLHKRPKPLIVPIFIPNEGCPHRCIFCNQGEITATEGQGPMDGGRIEAVIEEALASKTFPLRPRREIAFYGGTFTRLRRSRMKELLDVAARYVEKGLFASIRVSTRPDAVDLETLSVLRARHVTTVELGAQTMDDEVLDLSRRGYRAEDTVKAVRSLKEAGLKVGIQLMPGLPGDSRTKFLETIAKVLTLRPDMVRIYPALVIRNTELARWYELGAFQPLALEEAVSICKESCALLEENGIPVIRMGLMSSSTLLKEGQILAGPWHKAFGFLVRSAIHRDKIKGFLPKRGWAEAVVILAPRGEVPLVRGHENEGLRWIERHTGSRVVEIKSDDTLSAGQVRVVKAALDAESLGQLERRRKQRFSWN